MAGRGRRTRRHLAVVAAGALLCVTGASAAAALSPRCTRAGAPYALPCGVVAVVGDEPITTEEYAHWYAIAARSSGDAVAPDPPRYARCIAAKRKVATRATRGRLRHQCATEHRHLLEQAMQLLISFRRIRGEAAERGVAVSPAAVRAQFRWQKRASFPRQKDYLAFLAQTGQTEQDILTRVEADLLANKLRALVLAAAKPDVSRRDVARFYRRHRGRFQIAARRDLLVVLTKTRAGAAQARARIEAGEPWASVAAALSVDTESRAQGGRVPAVVRGQQDRALDRAIFSARRGAVHGPLHTRSGWYVFRVTRIQRAKQLPLAEAAGTIRELLRSRREEQVLDAFVADVTRRWRARTVCRQGYRVADCGSVGV